MESSYTVSPEEWAEAQKLWAGRTAKKLPGAKFVQYMPIFLGICVGLSFAFIPHFLSAMFAVYFIAWGAFHRWRRKALSRYLYEQATDRDQPIDLRIDDSGYSSIRPGFNECRMSWRCFTGWKEGDLVIVLGRGLQFCIVPKHVLSGEQLAELRTILRMRLGNL